MPIYRLCLVCRNKFQGKGSRCQKCRPVGRAPGYNEIELKRRARFIAQWRALHGNWCPGWQREGHFAEKLTADHIWPLSKGGPMDGPLTVLCGTCNIARNNRSTIRVVG